MKKIEITIPDGYEFDKETMSVIPMKDNMEYIDLGLPSKTLWAKYNIGATKPEEYGDYLNFDEAQKYNCPTTEQFEELINNCSWIWCTINQTNGYLVIGNNGNHIFLPCAGYCNDNGLNNVGSYGFCWSRTLDTHGSIDAWCLNFTSDSYIVSWNNRYYRRSVRPIKN